MGNVGMDRVLSLGYSPCPNDTFIFYALAQERIDTSPYRFDIMLADVEALNQRAQEKTLDVAKVSIYALVHLLDEYRVLRAGGAMGRGCGPLVVAREVCSMENLRLKSIAIPGRHTTAHLLLQLHGIHHGPRIEMPFDRIMPAIAAGEVDAGVIIHEGRWTYDAMGLRKVLDLGAWWEEKTGVPLPLGCIIIKRSLGLDAARSVEGCIRKSLLYARSNPEKAWPYITENAQEMETRIVQLHIETFVSDFSLDVGVEGENATQKILEAAFRQVGKPFPNLPIFS